MFKCLFVAFMSLIDAQCLQLISIRARTLHLLHLATIPELISIHKKQDTLIETVAHVVK